jgi:hypothetical protein
MEALALALALGATCHPPADPDGVRTGAAALPLGEVRTDSLACRSGCGGGGGDCADWWLVQVPGEGSVVVRVANEPGKGEPKQPPALVVKLVDASGQQVAQAEAVGTEAAGIASQVDRGSYFVDVEPRDPKQPGVLPYSLRASFEPRPPPPPAPKPTPPRPARETSPRPPSPPPTRTLTTAILETEGPPNRPTEVLLEAGRSAGIRAGLQGRIVDGGHTLATVTITEVYDDGSRARVIGIPDGRITPSSEVQIEVPIGGAP